MSDWPVMKMGPIREWPGELTPASKRIAAPFKSENPNQSYSRVPTPLSNTLEILERELRMLGAKDKELLVAMNVNDFRNDGYPRAQAKAEHPGVILTFVSKYGTQSYPCDTFIRWQDNLRAVALTLEAFRKIDRYGVTKSGDQYRAFLAIEGGRAMPAGIVSEAQAFDIILKSAGNGDLEPTWMEMPALAKVIRRAKRLTHPDLVGGGGSALQRVNEAEEFLRAAGKLTVV